jgi:hypothetical protein
MILDYASTMLTEVHVHDCMSQLHATKFSDQNRVGGPRMNTYVEYIVTRCWYIFTPDL